MADKLNWGIISTGRISGVFAEGLAASRTGRLVAVGSRTKASALKFASEHGSVKAYGSYAQVLEDSEVEAVYISTPHPMHAEWAIKAAEAGKHILCEKPVGINQAEALAIAEAARENDVFLMEAFMYRCHPQIARLLEIIRGGAIGEVRLIQAAFSFQSGFNPQGRLFNQALGGGGILDVGCYPVSLARIVAGASLDREIAEPEEVTGAAHIGKESRVDEWAVCSLKFKGGIIAQLGTGVLLNQENVARIFGSEGSIFMPTPWGFGARNQPARIVLKRQGSKEPEEILVDPPPGGLYAAEADAVADNLERRQAPNPAMSVQDTIGNMATLDRWRKAVGLTYDSEKPESAEPPLSRRPLKARPKTSMRYIRLEGLEKPVSCIIAGAASCGGFPLAPVMLDHWFELGGNAVDTAYIYGQCDRTLGWWMKNRAIRDRIVVLAKGAHSPHCNPEALTRQLLETLDRMQTDYVDIYAMHRDNPAVPVSEFIDVLNTHVRAGRIRCFAGSNWTAERFDAANAYAARKGLTGFAAMNNNFSLARMVEAPWENCLASSTPDFRGWHTRTKTPNISWSAQAQGFFTGLAHPERKDNPELVRCWYSDDNFERLRRAAELAAKRSVTANNIALAYVLGQPFPSLAIAGPRTPTETATLLPALDVSLTEEEMRWLNLES